MGTGIACLVGRLNLTHIAAQTAHAGHTALLVDDPLYVGLRKSIMLHQIRDGSGIHITDTSTHHQTLGRGQAHGSVHTLAAVHRSDGAAVAYMACHDLLGLYIHTEHLAHALRHIPVARAVETVAPHTGLLIKLIRQRIHICLGRHGLMESRVKHSHLGHVGHKPVDSFHTCHIGGIVQRRQRIALTHHLLHFVGDEHRTAEFRTPVDQTVANGVNLAV